MFENHEIELAWIVKSFLRPDHKFIINAAIESLTLAHKNEFPSRDGTEWFRLTRLQMLREDFAAECAVVLKLIRVVGNHVKNKKLLAKWMCVNAQLEFEL